MSDENLLKIDSTIRDSLEFYDNNREKYDIFFKKAKYVKFVDNNNTTDDIIFYDENKKILLESSYEIMGIYLPKNNMWKWAWSIPSIHKKYTFISRKILEYAFNLDHTKEFPLRADLINSKIKINNELQLDIRIALSSYIGKQPLIFKFYNKLDDDIKLSEIENNNSVFNNYTKNNKINEDLENSNSENNTDDQILKYFTDEDNNNQNHMIMYLFILDYENIKI